MVKIYMSILGVFKSNPKLWKAIGEAIIAFVTALVTALTTTSCLGRGPFYF